MEFAVHASKVMHCVPQAGKNTNTKRKIVQIRRPLWNDFISYEKHTIALLNGIMML
jgi:hypothetical protein